MFGLEKIFGKKTKSVIGVDIGSSTIKIVQLEKKRGKATLQTYGELALGPYADSTIGQATNLPPEKIAEALNDLIKEAKITTRVGGIAIPFGSSLISLIEMPALPQKQLAPMIPIEARKYIPVPITEVTLDWWILPKEEKIPDPDETPSSIPKTEKVDVLTVAIHNEVISKFKTVIQNASLDASFLEIEIFSTLRAIQEQDVHTVMIFDMGAASTKLYLVERGIIRSSHIINRGSQDITIALSKALSIEMQDAEIMKRNYGTRPGDHDKEIADLTALTLDYVFAEASRVILSYQKRYNKDVKKVVLVGGGVKISGFLELAKKNLQTEVILGDPFEKIQTPAFLEQVLKKTGPEFAVAVGVALRRLQELE